MNPADYIFFGGLGTAILAVILLVLVPVGSGVDVLAYLMLVGGMAGMVEGVRRN